MCGMIWCRSLSNVRSTEQEFLIIIAINIIKWQFDTV